MAAIERHPYLVDCDQAARIVDADLDDLGGITEAHGRTDGAAPVLAAVEVRRAGECALDGDGAFVDQRCGYDIGEGQARLIALADVEHFATFDVFWARFELLRGGLRSEE